MSLATIPAGDATSRPSPTALPVTVAVRGRLADPVRRAVEGELGWQPVDEATATLVPPALRLVDVSSPEDERTPCVLLVVGDDQPLAVAQAVQRLRPATTIDWPADAAALGEAAATAVARPRSAVAPAAVVRVGGAGGGVGTTTVAASLAGLAAWRDHRSLLVAGDPTVVPEEAPSVDPSALTAPDLWDRAAPLLGVAGARAVRTWPPAVDGVVGDARIDVTVLDLGVADDVDVLVCHPDARALAALARTTAPVVVVVGDGPLPHRVLSAAIAGRRRLDLPWSTRVARASARGRVPTSLPGRFLERLLPLVPSRPIPG